jgi:hypothetical protein
MTALRWEGHYGYDDGGCVMASIVYYDVPRGWTAFICLERLGGPWATETEAMAAAEVFAADIAPGPLTLDGLEDVRRRVREVGADG